MATNELPELPPNFMWTTNHYSCSVRLRANPSIQYARVFVSSPHFMAYWQDGRAGYPPTWGGTAPTLEEAMKILAMRFWLGEWDE